MQQIFTSYLYSTYNIWRDQQRNGQMTKYHKLFSPEHFVYVCTMCCLLHIIDNVFGNVLLGVVHLPVIVLFHIYCFIEQHPGDIQPHRKEAGGGQMPYSTQIGPDMVRWLWSYISPEGRDGQSISILNSNHYCIANGNTRCRGGVSLKTSLERDDIDIRETWSSFWVVSDLTWKWTIDVLGCGSW